MDKMRRKVVGAAGASVVAAALPAPVFAQSAPIKIGMSMPQTGALGGGGQAALVALRLWVDDVNGRGGLLGRKVEFIARETVLPPQLFHRFDNDMFWRDPAANRHHVRIVGRV